MAKLIWITVPLVLYALITIPLIAAESSAQDEAIKTSVMAFPAAWAKHDPQSMAALWVEDGDLTNPFGRVAKGRTEVQKLFTDEQTGPMKATHFDLKVTSIKMIGRSVAVVDTDIHITGVLSAEGKELPAMDHHALFVLHKASGTWQYEAVRAYTYAPKP